MERWLVNILCHKADPWMASSVWLFFQVRIGIMALAAKYLICTFGWPSNRNFNLNQTEPEGRPRTKDFEGLFYEDQSKKECLCNPQKRLCFNVCICVDVYFSCLRHVCGRVKLYKYA